MGKVEKLVVLTVLFLTAIVIAVTLRKDESALDSGKSDPLSAAQEQLSEQGSGALPGAAQTPPADQLAVNAASGKPAQPLLSSNVRPEGAKPAPAGLAPANPALGGAQLAQPQAPAAAQGMIKNADGLRPGLTAGMFVYDWKAGDSWASVAQRVYGDARHETMLRADNEGVKQPKVGDPVLVLAHEGGVPSPAAPVNALAKPGASSTAPASATPATEVGGGARTHTVKSGDSLSSIAKQYYGSTAKWKQIADANKDTLKDPNKLKVGMKLRIP